MKNSIFYIFGNRFNPDGVKLALKGAGINLPVNGVGYDNPDILYAGIRNGELHCFTTKIDTDRAIIALIKANGLALVIGEPEPPIIDEGTNKLYYIDGNSEYPEKAKRALEQVGIKVDYLVCNNEDAIYFGTPGEKVYWTDSEIEKNIIIACGIQLEEVDEKKPLFYIKGSKYSKSIEAALKDVGILVGDFDELKNYDSWFLFGCPGEPCSYIPANYDATVNIIKNCGTELQPIPENGNK